MEEAIGYIDFGYDFFWKQVKPIIKALCLPNKWTFSPGGEGNFDSLKYELGNGYQIVLVPDDDSVYLYQQKTYRGPIKYVFNTTLKKFDIEQFNQQLAMIGF